MFEADVIIKGYEQRINNLIMHKYDMGAKDMEIVVEGIKSELDEIIEGLESLPNGTKREKEPNTLEEIRKASKINEKKKKKTISKKEYLKKLQGAIVGRFSGCALGAPVEFIPIDIVKNMSETLGTKFPPIDYWEDCPVHYFPRYKVGEAQQFTKGNMKALPPDDDITYTILALLILEKYGEEFRVDDVAEIWQDLLPLECVYTAELATMKNLAKGIAPMEAGNYKNPEQELIGADIRCDGWAYVNPLNPIKATELAYKDAYLSHRRTGIYGAMYFAAVISLAFGATSIVEALEEGLDYIPTECEFAKWIRWAIDYYPNIQDYTDATKAISKYMPKLHQAHTINNACLTIWGVMLGENDFTKGISQTVAMGYDNDCTAATVGSILGAYLGFDAISKHWYEPWNDTAISYLNNIESFSIQDIISRFYAIGSKTLEM